MSRSKKNWDYLVDDRGNYDALGTGSGGQHIWTDVDSVVYEDMYDPSNPRNGTLLYQVLQRSCKVFESQWTIPDDGFFTAVPRADQCNGDHTYYYNFWVRVDFNPEPCCYDTETGLVIPGTDANYDGECD